MLPGDGYPYEPDHRACVRHDGGIPLAQTRLTLLTRDAPLVAAAARRDSGADSSRDTHGPPPEVGKHPDSRSVGGLGPLSFMAPDNSVRCTGGPDSCVNLALTGPPDSSADSSSEVHSARPRAPACERDGPRLRTAAPLLGGSDAHRASGPLRDERLLPPVVGGSQIRGAAEGFDARPKYVPLGPRRATGETALHETRATLGGRRGG